jgi:hypothetical protein
MSVNGSKIKDACERNAKPHTCNKIFNKRIYQINKKKKKVLETDFDKFVFFAKQSKKNILKTTLPETSVDEKKITLILKHFKLPVICIAWVEFLKSDDPYLTRENRPRNIPVFVGQFSNLSQKSEIIFNQSQNKFLKKKESGIVSSVGKNELEKWKQCLDSIESEILPNNFEAFIKPLKLMGIENSKAKIICPNKDSKKYLQYECGEEFFQRHLSNVFGKNLQPKFIFNSQA